MGDEQLHVSLTVLLEYIHVSQKLENFREILRSNMS